MNMHLITSIAVALLVSTATAWSADRACMIEGSFTIAGKTLSIKNCMEFTVAIPDTKLKESCNSLAQIAPLDVSKPGKVTYLPQCPLPASGICKGLLGQPTLNAYYYNLSPSEIQEKREACGLSLPQTKPGTWSNGQ